MTEKLSSLEARMEQLAAQVEALTGKVDALSVRMNSHGARPVGDRVPPQEDTFPDPSEALLSWVGRSSLLQRLSTLCFLLVIALILRTITDNGMINLQLGSIIGMSYAAALIILGWRRYRRTDPLAPIFTVCGTVLMFTIVVEAHAHFEALPSVPAYVLLMLTGLGTAVISYAYRAPAPVAVGTLGMCLAGAAIDYPSPFFPYLGIVLLTANLLGYLGARAHRYAWLRWIVLMVTVFMVTLWGIKLGMSLLAGETPPRILAPVIFLPLLSVFAAMYTAMALLGIIRSLPERIHRFELALPAINGIWAFLLADYVVSAMGGSRALLGSIGICGGVGHLAISHWLAGRDPEGARGTNAFVFGGSVLLALSLPTVTGNMLLTLPILAGVALWLAVMSRRWSSGSVRLTSYLLNMYVGATLAAVLLGQDATTSFPGNAVSSAAVACISLVQFRWCRSRKPSERSAFFTKVDKSDVSAVIILMAALLSVFLALRSIVFSILGGTLAPADLKNALICSQSIIINLSAIVLIFFALAHRDRELRNVAILVTVLGAFKVFLYDLLSARGMPLVVSVLSFGLATAVESVILGRWQRLSPSLREKGR